MNGFDLEYAKDLRQDLQDLADFFVFGCFRKKQPKPIGHSAERDTIETSGMRLSTGWSVEFGHRMSPK